MPPQAAGGRERDGWDVLGQAILVGRLHRQSASMVQKAEELRAARVAKRVLGFALPLLGPRDDVPKIGRPAQRVEMGICGECRHRVETALDGTLEHLERAILLAGDRQNAGPVKEPFGIGKPGVY